MMVVHENSSLAGRGMLRELRSPLSRLNPCESTDPCLPECERLDGEDRWLFSALRARSWSEQSLLSVERHFSFEKKRSAGLTLSALVLRLGLLTGVQWAECLAETVGWPLVSRADLNGLDLDVWGRLTTEFGRRVGAGVLQWDADRILLAVVDPRRLSGLKKEWKERLAPLLKPQTRVEWRVICQADLDSLYDRSRSSVAVAATLTGRALIQELLREAVQDEASDIHFIPREHALEVRYRIDGRLWTRHLFSSDRKEEILANAKMAGGLDIGKRGEPLDGAGRVVVGARQFKLRYSSMPSQFGQQVVVRLLDQEATALPLPDLGIAPQDLAQVMDAISRPQGLIFMVGPTGSGKSTTLASLISHLDGGSFSIRTLENPIEYRLANAVQSEVGPDMSFAEGLRALLRQDPDYLLVGETRDLETAEISIEAGLTGHLCLSTLHANDAIGGLVRLLDLGVETGPLLASCHLFIAQRLVRRLCKRCARPREDAEAILSRLSVKAGPGEQLWEPVGCAFCRDGYRGRVGVYEVRAVRDFEELVQREGSSCARACRVEATRLGLSTMRSDGLRKSLRGLTTVEEVIAQTPG